MRLKTAQNEKERLPTIARKSQPMVSVHDRRHRGAIGIFNDPVELNGKQKGEF